MGRQRFGVVPLETDSVHDHDNDSSAMKAFEHSAPAMTIQKTESPLTASDKRIPELDGLRGVAIFSVILYHYIANAPHPKSNIWLSRIANVLTQGAIGVDLFFVLSGFLIGGILLASRESPRYFRTFYLRRFYRIIPLYYGWLLLFGLLGLIERNWGGPTGAEFYTVRPYWAHFLFIQNYYCRSDPCLNVLAQPYLVVGSGGAVLFGFPTGRKTFAYRAFGKGDGSGDSVFADVPHISDPGIRPAERRYGDFRRIFLDAKSRR